MDNHISIMRFLQENILPYNSHSDIRYQIGLILYNKGLYDNASREFKEVVKDKPKLANGHFNLANSYNAKGMITDAILEYDAALKLEPGLKGARAVYDSVLEKDNTLMIIIRTLRKEVGLNPDKPELLYRLGNSLYQKGLYYEAVPEYLELIVKQPDFANAHNNLANCYACMGMLEEAINEYSKAITFNPDFATAYNNMGIAYDKSGQFKNAIINYKKAISLDSGFLAPRYNLGMDLYRIGAFDHLTSLYNEEISLKIDNSSGDNTIKTIMVLKDIIQGVTDRYYIIQGVSDTYYKAI